MKYEKTFAIIKPNAMRKNCLGDILSMWEANGLQVLGAKLIHIARPLAEEFYAEHSGRSFFPELITFMTSAPVLVLCLGGENAVVKNREVMGATDPVKSLPGTIRYKFGDSVGENAVHGSDSVASAERELKLFFGPKEIFSH